LAPDCLRSWLQDPDGDGIYSFSTTAIPAGNYEGKVAHNESWDVNYGVGGIQNGDNYAFSVAADGNLVSFSYDPSSHVLTIDSETPPPPPPDPMVNIPGSMQSELGCPGDWQPDCAATYLDYDAVDDVYQRVFEIPAGDYAYKAALNGTWDVNYGANATLNGADINLNLSETKNVKFYYDHKTHWITDNVNKIIATVPGASKANSAAQATGSQTACARGCRTRMAMAFTASPPQPSQQEIMKAKWRTMSRGTSTLGSVGNRAAITTLSLCLRMRLFPSAMTPQPIS
jgi:hypothetical protein